MPLATKNVNNYPMQKSLLTRHVTFDNLNENFHTFFGVLLFYFSLHPFVFWKLTSSPLLFKISTVAFAGFTLIECVRGKVNQNQFQLAAIFLIYVLFLILLQDGQKLPYHPTGLIGLFFLFISPYSQLLKIFQWVKKTFVLFGIPTLVCFFLLAAGIHVPFTRIIHDGNGYHIYWLGVVVQDPLVQQFGIATFIRPAGIFEEPSTLGTISSLLFLAGSGELKNKSNLILLAIGAVTFSTTFYAIVAMYYVLKRPLISVLLGSIFIPILFLLSTVNKFFSENIGQKLFGLNKNPLVYRFVETDAGQWQIFMEANWNSFMGGISNLEIGIRNALGTNALYNFGVLGYSGLLLFFLCLTLLSNPHKSIKPSLHLFFIVFCLYMVKSTTFSLPALFLVLIAVYNYYPITTTSRRSLSYA